MKKLCVIMAFVALITILIMTPTVGADSCGRQVIVRNQAVVTTHANQVVVDHTPLAFPVLFPTVAVPVYSYVNTPGYVTSTGVNAGGASQDNIDQLAELLLRKIEAKAAAKQGVQGAQSGPPAARAADTRGVEQLLVSKCSACHSGGAANGGGVSFIDGGRLKNLSREALWDIYDACYEGRMPKGGQALSDDEVELLRKRARQK